MSKVDGRKATVIEAGSRFTTYREFAKKYGYPEAAADSDWDDKRSGLRNGDEVKLLVGGAHLSGMYRDRTLWIVETSVGDRYIIADDGLEIAVGPDIHETLAGLVDTVAKLSVKVAELERRASPQPERKYTKVLSGDVDDTLPSFAREPLTRDDIVERAKVDVAELLRTSRSVPFDHISFWPQVDGGKTDWIPLQNVEFAVNREKRTVAALIKFLPKYRERNLYAKGIAKAAPGDVFNSHIGRAISLRRALGLEVPGEYVNTPKPESVRVGDIVRWRECGESTYEILRVKSGNRYDMHHVEGDQTYYGCSYESLLDIADIIDDSREDGTEVGA